MEALGPSSPPPLLAEVCVPGWEYPEMVGFPLPSFLVCGNSECLLLKFTFFLLYKYQRKVEVPPPETYG